MPALTPEIEQLAGLGNALAVHDVELDLTLNGGATLFLTTFTRVWLPTTSSRSLIAPMRRMSRRTEA